MKSFANGYSIFSIFLIFLIKLQNKMSRATNTGNVNPREQTGDFPLIEVTSDGSRLIGHRRPSTGNKFTKEKRFFERDRILKDSRNRPGPQSYAADLSNASNSKFNHK
jgi:hypothetical protein